MPHVPEEDFQERLMRFDRVWQNAAGRISCTCSLIRGIFEPKAGNNRGLENVA
jgi:hypothetical protein